MSTGTVFSADLEFYFPVGVNAPAVQTIQELTDAWASENPQHNVKAVYAGNYEETTTKALTAANAGKPPHVAVLLAIDIFTLAEEDVCGHVHRPYQAIWNRANCIVAGSPASQAGS